MYARGKIAWGNCDRCGFRFLLNTLRAESVKGNSRNNRVCSSCWDPDHPQNWLGSTPVYDPQALRNPRPDVAETAVTPYTPPYGSSGGSP